MAEKDDYLLDLLVDLGFTSAEVVAKAREEANAAGVGAVVRGDVMEGLVEGVGGVSVRVV